mmetsp:Transcript_11912/g.31112  ORF Transcript_11912/g.31112 Transcript_11912/m.31112 type:complete len:255 (-) Transcript_11912:67-831(-)
MGGGMGSSGPGSIGVSTVGRGGAELGATGSSWATPHTPYAGTANMGASAAAAEAAHAHPSTGEATVHAIVGLQRAQAELLGALGARDAIRLEHMLRRKDDAMLAYLRERVSFDSARALLGMVEADPDPYSAHVHSAPHVRAELALLGAQVEAQRRQYASALEQLSIEAAIALPPSELQQLHDLNSELERALRAALAQHEAARPSRRATDKYVGGAGADDQRAPRREYYGRQAEPVLAGAAGASTDDESAVCSLQ